MFIFQVRSTLSGAEVAHYDSGYFKEKPYCANLHRIGVAIGTHAGYRNMNGFSRIYLEPVLFSWRIPEWSHRHDYCISTPQHIGESLPVEWECNLMRIPPQAKKQFPMSDKKFHKLRTEKRSCPRTKRPKYTIPICTSDKWKVEKLETDVRMGTSATNCRLNKTVLPPNDWRWCKPGK